MSHYRTFKCIFGRTKLRNYNAENALCELTWSLIGLWAANQIALSNSGIASDRLSMAGVIRSLQTTLTHYRVRPDHDEDHYQNLRLCVLDNCNRKPKSCRNPTILTQHYKAARKPKIDEPNNAQLRKIKSIKNKIRQLRLTA